MIRIDVPGTPPKSGEALQGLLVPPEAASNPAVPLPGSAEAAQQAIPGAKLWRNHPLFAAAGVEICQQLSAQSQIQRARDGDSLICAGEPVASILVLFDGKAAAYKRNADGRELLSRLVEGPSAFGDLELLQGLCATHDVEAVGEAWFARVPGDTYRGLLEHCPNLARAQLQHVAAQAYLSNRNEALVFASLEQRIGNVLLAYAQYFGRPAKSGGILVDRPLSLKTIARSVGGVWRSVGHALSALRNKGVLGKQGEMLVIEQPAALRDLTLAVSGGLNYRMGMSLVAGRSGRRPPSGEIEIAKGPERCEGQQVIVEDKLLIGREPEVDLVIPDDNVGPRHCRVFRSQTGGRFWIQDLDSDAGTLVNGEPVRRAVLHDGDRISLGEIEMVFRLARDGEDGFDTGELLRE